MLICGIDEVGRGPLAGPVTAAAVILDEDFPVEILNDSKKLSLKKREIAYKEIMEKALAVGTGWVSPATIDEINIHNASLLAMEKAFEQVQVKFQDSLQDLKCLVDGKYSPRVDVPCEAVIGGDALIHQIMAASIVAKVERDNYMVELGKKYPEYFFDKHKGYPTKLHREMCAKFGISPVHRKSFRIL